MKTTCCLIILERDLPPFKNISKKFNLFCKSYRGSKSVMMSNVFQLKSASKLFVLSDRKCWWWGGIYSGRSMIAATPIPPAVQIEMRPLP